MWPRIVALTPPGSWRVIPFVPALELYRDAIMPRLADGPKTLTVLDVPLYAMQHLERARLVRSKREKVQLTTGTLAIQVWYRAEDFPSRATVADCAILDFDGLENETVGWTPSRA